MSFFKCSWSLFHFLPLLNRKTTDLLFSFHFLCKITPKFEEPKKICQIEDYPRNSGGRRAQYNLLDRPNGTFQQMEHWRSFGLGGEPPRSNGVLRQRPQGVPQETGASKTAEGITTCKIRVPTWIFRARIPTWIFRARVRLWIRGILQECVVS